jgi:hypothetical protein
LLVRCSGQVHTIECHASDGRWRQTDVRALFQGLDGCDDIAGVNDDDDAAFSGNFGDAPS